MDSETDVGLIIVLRRGVTTAGDTGDASPVRYHVPLHQSDNRQFVFGADF